MPAALPIPADLLQAPFTSATAREYGIGRGVLAGKRFRQVFRGVWIAAEVEITFEVLLRAAALTMPIDAVVSHTSAMRLYGLDPRRGRHQQLEFSTNTTTVTRHRSITLHRRTGRLTPYKAREFVVTGPDRTFVDCAGSLSFVELIQLGDWLLHSRHSTVNDLFAYASARHLDGVRKARRALRYVRERTESPLETALRLMLVFARLPEPECNVDIFCGNQHLARGDLVYEEWRVVVEYDGWHHERDAAQRLSDIGRREHLEAAGWTIIVVTAGDLKRPREIPWRVHRALVAHGYAGGAPQMSVVWDKWFR